MRLQTKKQERIYEKIGDLNKAIFTVKEYVNTTYVVNSYKLSGDSNGTISDENHKIMVYPISDEWSSLTSGTSKVIVFGGGWDHFSANGIFTM